MMRDTTKKAIRVTGVVLFILYLCALTYFLFFSEKYGRTITDREYRYNLVPFLEIKRFWTYRDVLGPAAVATNLLGNVIAFFPFGSILPVISRRTRGFFRIMFFSFEFSFVVECIQLVTRVGTFDVDDMILNTLGGVIGYLIFVVCNSIRRQMYG